jgi:hypothetical protein
MRVLVLFQVSLKFCSSSSLFVSTWLDFLIYSGEFFENKKHGKGTFSWTNGNKYKGDFCYEQRTGQGIYTWKEVDTLFHFLLSFFLLLSFVFFRFLSFFLFYHSIFRETDFSDA